MSSMDEPTAEFMAEWTVRKWDLVGGLTSLETCLFSSFSLLPCFLDVMGQVALLSWLFCHDISVGAHGRGWKLLKLWAKINVFALSCKCRLFLSQKCKGDENCISNTWKKNAAHPKKEAKPCYLLSEMSFVGNLDLILSLIICKDLLGGWTKHVFPKVRFSYSM